MEKVIDQQLSNELQSLYFQNRQWLADVLFLEDASGIFRKVYDHFFLTALDDDHSQHVHQLNERLLALESHRKELKSLIIKHQYVLERIITIPDQVVGIYLMAEHAKIVNDIRQLFAADHAVKKELSYL